MRFPMKIMLTLTILCFFSSPSFAEYRNICDDWRTQRDTEILGLLSSATERYARALDAQDTWASRMNEINETNAEFWLDVQAASDILLLGFQVTADTVGLAVNLSGIGNLATVREKVAYIEALEDSASIVSSASFEEAGLRHVGQTSTILRDSLKSIKVIETLIAARERFADRAEAKATVKAATTAVQRNLRTSSTNLESAQANFENWNSFVQVMDSKCSDVSSDATSCISTGKETNDRGGEMVVFSNSCAEDVHLFWCYESGTERFPKPCGDRRHFRFQRVLKAGNSYSNRYNTPANLGMDYGACFGSRYTAELSADGSFFCR